LLATAPVGRPESERGAWKQRVHRDRDAAAARALCPRPDLPDARGAARMSTIEYADPRLRGAEPETASRRRVASATWTRRGLIVVAAFAVLLPILASRIAFAASPLGTDQGLYVTIAEMIHRGGVPWRDAFELKPPGTYYLYAAVLAGAPDYAQQ